MRICDHCESKENLTRFSIVTYDGDEIDPVWSGDLCEPCKEATQERVEKARLKPMPGEHDQVLYLDQAGDTRPVTITLPFPGKNGAMYTIRNQGKGPIVIETNGLDSIEVVTRTRTPVRGPQVK